MKPKKIISIAILALWILSTILLSSGAAFPAGSAEGLASPYLFNLPRWEAINLWDVLLNRFHWSGRNSSSVEQSDSDLVKEYFSLGEKIRTLQSRIEQLRTSGPGGNQQIKPVEAQLQAVRQERKNKEARVKTIITRQIGQVLSSEGVLPLPPVVFAFDTPPRILVIAPREKIDLKKTILLEPGLSIEQATEMEQRIEGLAPSSEQVWGVSALVEELGGLALYPSLIPEISSLSEALPTIAHEWTHQYLFFHPLGQKYGASYNMTTINETVADIVGNEVGALVLRDYGLRLEKRPRKKPSGFDFNQEMRQTRLRVDELLAKGQVKEAESYMEERRRLLAKEGYYLRRLNQAYFAFHGSYGDSPGSVSPVAGWLHIIRDRSASLGDFLHSVAQISSYQELERLATD